MIEPNGQLVEWAVSLDSDRAQKVSVTARTAYQAWQLAAPHLPGDPGFNAVHCEIVEEKKT